MLAAEAIVKKFMNFALHLHNYRDLCDVTAYSLHVPDNNVRKGHLAVYLHFEYKSQDRKYCNTNFRRFSSSESNG